MSTLVAPLPRKSAEPHKGNFPIRQRTGTASFHMSKAAVDFGLEDLERLTARGAVELFAKLRWGSFTHMGCPHCGTHDKHYWCATQLRWKCKACDKRFSVTSGTPLADHKLPLVKILKMAYTSLTSAAGTAALQIRRVWNVQYRTAYVLEQKLREGFMRGFNTGVLAGTHQMDGMDANGKRYKEKRNKPQGGGRAPRPTLPAALLKPKVDPETGEILNAGPPKPFKHDKISKQPPDRRLVLVLRQDGVSDGKGAVSTRVSIALTESAATVTATASTYASAESRFYTDEDPAYARFSKLFAGHQAVAHSKTYSTPDGVNNNQAESFNRRARRLLEGIHLSVSNKYMLDYMCGAAWREDTRKLSSGKRLMSAFHLLLNIGQSRFWRGYTQGKYREHEMLVEGPKPASPRGKLKDAKPKLPR